MFWLQISFWVPMIKVTLLNIFFHHKPINSYVFFALLAESLLLLLVVRICQILLLSYENPTEWVVKDLPACVGTQTVHDSLVKLFPRLLISVLLNILEEEKWIKIGLMCVAVRRPNLPRCRFLCLLHDWWLFKWYNYIDLIFEFVYVRKYIIYKHVSRYYYYYWCYIGLFMSSRAP